VIDDVTLPFVTSYSITSQYGAQLASKLSKIEETIVTWPRKEKTISAVFEGIANWVFPVHQTQIV